MGLRGSTLDQKTISSVKEKEWGGGGGVERFALITCILSPFSPAGPCPKSFPCFQIVNFLLDV